jgi:kanamycin kinase
MDLKPSKINVEDFPNELQHYIMDSDVYDSSFSVLAKTLFIDKDKGYYLKIAAKGSLVNESIMTQYFYEKGLSSKVCEYISEYKDFLLTEKIPGENGITKKYLDEPEKLCDLFSASLRMLHEVLYD